MKKVCLEEAICELLAGENYETKTMFLYEYLSDINWHTEAKDLVEKYESHFNIELDDDSLNINKNAVERAVALSYIFGFGLSEGDFDDNLQGDNLVNYLWDNIIIKK